ncbi:hypothetical protein COT12_00185 [Candidatus Berkelbacteria bacterium CG08_land_8_20_14_0_20_39_8]|uniref:Leucine--tRNA ligase n=1 Tax=Candidatus Berkelbacteria bacterium CG08_land_8_20_14_0_20_39_8 TaxID=1974511 RepID=A0A2M6YD24_9BACT|nr:MAG: hypothetical protein COT12_00185 [Candidatus Berkelbacteria bacterium CG08_land_8_20_14_0_20_39_8]
MTNKLKKNFYCLDMFPYPSGSGLHVGHPRGYTATDVYSRFKKLQGYNVLHPMGWDAFGLPAENYAIKNKTHPAKVVEENVAHFKSQLEKFDLSYDWDKEVNTTDPKYYRWTQFIFLKLFERGLAYEAEVPINYCPSCKTGLANEEVVGGKCERCGAGIERKNIRQWILKITEYADRLLEDLDGLDWPEPIKEMQRNWIGRSEGSNIKFTIQAGKKTVLLVHGFTGNSKENWFPWLKEKLESQGYKVIIPDLPNSDRPVVSEWVATLSKYKSEIEGDLIVIGHSLGAAAACMFLEQTNTNAEKLILVAPTGPSEKKWEGLKKVDFTVEDIKVLNQFNAEEINFEKLNNLVKSKYIYLSQNDPYVPISIKEDYKNLGATIRLFENKGHFNHGTGVTSLPEILSDIEDAIEVYTTRADTLYGCTWVVLAPEHKIISKLKSQISNLEEVEKYIEKSQNKSDLERTELQKEKTGVELKGVKVINPINGKEVAVWIADYVLGHYGTGAVMAVPAHDERDFEFAKKYDIEVIPSVVKSSGNYRSYLMGASDISDQDLEKLNIKIVQKLESDVRKIEIPKESIAKYEELITEQLSAGFWNEYVGERIVFIFKHKDNMVERLEYTNRNIDRINKLSAEFTNDASGKTIITNWLDNGADGYYQEYLLSKDYGVLINSNGFDGLDSETAKKRITEKLKESGYGDFTVNYKLRDWVFSRQRYWGEPIPIVHCEKCGIVAVPEKDLPVLLPHVEKYEPTGDGTSPLSNELDPAIATWLNTTCPKCGGKAKRETNTMPQWAGSCWYYIAYLMKSDDDYIWNRGKIDPWLPVDLYVGGAEHAVLHLLYARFWHKVLFDEKLVGTIEPFQRLISVGTILGIDGQKMSKSRGNTIDPDPILDKYGSDALKMYELYIGPFSQPAKWSQNGIVGMYRFLQKIKKISDAKISLSNNDNLTLVNKAIKKVGDDIELFNFNTAISCLFETFDAIDKNGWDIKSVEIFLTLLSPFAPKTTNEISNKINIKTGTWPKVNEKYLHQDKICIAIQINGKVRDQIEISTGENEENLKNSVLDREKIKGWIPNSGIQKFIYVKGKIISIVT